MKGPTLHSDTESLPFASVIGLLKDSSPLSRLVEASGFVNDESPVSGPPLSRCVSLRDPLLSPRGVPRSSPD